MKTKQISKIGFIFIILIFSLASISISYAGFIDIIKVNVTVDTWDEPASISDFVWNDIDRDGIQDQGEPGIPNVVVNLYMGDGTFVGTTTTDENGIYIFDNLAPGEYYVEFILPDIFLFSPMDSGNNDGVDSDANTTTGQTIVTLLEPGENDVRWDAGLWTPYEGCTPGYWKNHHNSWVGYIPSQTLGEIFEFPTELSELESYTLDEALNFGGGETLLEKAQILMRAAVAALLNAAHPNVNYPLTDDQVKSQVNTTLATLDPIQFEDLKDTFDYYNNLHGCLCG